MDTVLSRNFLKVNGGCPGVPVHGGIPIVFISIHGFVTHSLMFRSFVYRYTRTQPVNVLHIKINF